MGVNSGKAVKEYLLNEVTLLQIHRFDFQPANLFVNPFELSPRI